MRPLTPRSRVIGSWSTYAQPIDSTCADLLTVHLCTRTSSHLLTPMLPTSKKETLLVCSQASRLDYGRQYGQQWHKQIMDVRQ